MCSSTRYYYFKKNYFKLYLGVISGLLILMENIVFFFPFLASNLHHFGPVISLDMSVNNTSNSSIFHLLPFHKSELG